MVIWIDIVYQIDYTDDLFKRKIVFKFILMYLYYMT